MIGEILNVMTGAGVADGLLPRGWPICWLTAVPWIGRRTGADAGDMAKAQAG